MLESSFGNDVARSALRLFEQFGDVISTTRSCFIRGQIIFNKQVRIPYHSMYLRKSNCTTDSIVSCMY